MVECDSIECNSIEPNSIECNSHEASGLNKQQFRLNEINEIKDYFVADIRLMNNE